MLDSSRKSGLTARERPLLRFGLLTGLADWEQAGEVLVSLLDKGLLTGPEVERAAAESAMVKGFPACRHLAPVLAARDLRPPADVSQAVEAVQQESSLSEREVFALGLGITWGARCWDT
ncbi:MAG: hypothetical protein M0Z41_11140 [Peptococcaceae bacterium]|nr:hypothetical protein [Peptococcaceae bacterium]